MLCSKQFALGLVMVGVGGMSSSTALAQFTHAPLHASKLSADQPMGEWLMFRSTNFRQPLPAVTDASSWNLIGLHPSHSGASSVRWNLSDGQMWVLYRDAPTDNSWPGEMVALWGEGEIRSLDKLNFNDDCSSGVLYTIDRMKTDPPLHAEPLTDKGKAPPEGGFQFFLDKKFVHPMATLDVADQPRDRQLDVHETYGKASSIKWDLPPGVMIVFYEHKYTDGRWPGMMFVIWGKGQRSSLKDFHMNDEISTMVVHEFK